MDFTEDKYSATRIIEKIIFVLDADECIERLEGKIRECLFFYVKLCKNCETFSANFIFY